MNNQIVFCSEKALQMLKIDNYNSSADYEIKTSTTVKAAIREALGQILEYNHYPNKNNAQKLMEKRNAGREYMRSKDISLQ